MRCQSRGGVYLRELNYESVVRTYKCTGLRTCTISNDRGLNCIEIFPFARAQMEQGRSGRSSGVPEQYLPYNRCFVMSPRYFCEAFDCRPLTWEFAHRIQHVSHCLPVAYKSLPCLDRDRPNVKRNFTARLRAIALSPCDTVMRMSKLLLYYPRGVML